MIRSVRFRGFKSIGDQTLDLGRVNVLIGANGSGKSNVLEALGVLGAAASGRVDDQALLRRGVRPGVPALYKSALAGKRIPRLIRLSATWSQPGSPEVAYTVALENPIETPKPAWRYSAESMSRGGKQLLGRSPRGGGLGAGVRRGKTRDIPLSPDAGLAAIVRGRKELDGAPRRLLESLVDYAIYAPVTPVLRAIAPDPAPRPPVGLFGGQLAEAVATIHRREEEQLGAMHLSEVYSLIEWAISFDAAPPSAAFVSPSVPAARYILRFTDRFMRAPRNNLSGYDGSEGALYVLFALVLAMHPQTPALFALDNFDQSLNPRLARKLAGVFCREILRSAPRRQVLLTTHNPLVLDGLDLANDEIRLFAVDRGRDGATVVTRVTVDGEILRKRRMSLSRLWVEGRLGGVPNL